MSEKSFPNAFTFAFTVETKHTRVEKGGEMDRQNLIGFRVAYLRNQKKWTQKTLAAKLQCRGVDISRLSVARIEYGIIKVNDKVLAGLLRVFRLPIIQFFPQEIRDLDADYAQNVAEQPPNPLSTKKRRRKCPKLTKRRKED